MSGLSQELASISVQGPTAVTIGVFDGVHRGHQHLIRRLRQVAERNDATPVVVTFRNHPLAVLRPDVPLALLSTLDERLELLQAAGVKHVAAITFNRDLSLLSAEEFVLALRDSLGMAHLVVGPDFALGHQRSGTIPVLEELGRQLGFTLDVADELTLEGDAVNSTAIRAALSEGDVRRAAHCLGRPYTLSETVERGEGRGAELGFPTANIGLPPERALPANGVYAAWLSAGDQRYQAAVSIGTKPTFHQAGPKTVEAHVLGFSGDLYGVKVGLEFVDHVRAEERFPSAEALITQMHRDVAAVRKLLADAPVVAES